MVKLIVWTLFIGDNIDLYEFFKDSYFFFFFSFSLGCFEEKLKNILGEFSQIFIICWRYFWSKSDFKEFCLWGGKAQFVNLLAKLGVNPSQGRWWIKEMNY